MLPRHVSAPARRDDRRVAVGMEGGADGVRLLVPDEQADEALEVLRDS